MMIPGFIVRPIVGAGSILGVVWGGLYLWRRNKRLDQIEDAELKSIWGLGEEGTEFNIVSEETDADGVTTLSVRTETQYENSGSGGAGWLLPDVFDDSAVSKSFANDLAHAWQGDKGYTRPMPGYDGNGNLVSFTIYRPLPPGRNAAGTTQYGIKMAFFTGQPLGWLKKRNTKKSKNWSDSDWYMYQWAWSIGVEGQTVPYDPSSNSGYSADAMEAKRQAWKNNPIEWGPFATWVSN